MDIRLQVQQAEQALLNDPPNVLTTGCAIGTLKAAGRAIDVLRSFAIRQLVVHEDRDEETATQIVDALICEMPCDGSQG